jgi:hypothetical protein
LVISGTVAQRAGLVIGETVQIMVDERDADPVYGRQFNHTRLGVVDMKEILGLRKELGTPVIVSTGIVPEGNILDNDANLNAAKGATPGKVNLQSGLGEETEELEETEKQ